MRWNTMRFVPSKYGGSRGPMCTTDGPQVNGVRQVDLSSGERVVPHRVVGFRV